jgi:hypothetical protein
MNTRTLVKVTNFGLGLILSLVWAFNAFSHQVHAQGGREVDPTPPSKRDVKFDRSQTRPVSGGLSIASVQNPGFENGSDGAWTEYSAHSYQLLYSSADLGLTPHGGDWAAWLGGADSETASISQTVAIAPGATTLRLWEWIGSADACGFDFGEILINHTAVYSISLCSETNTAGWVNETFDLGAYVGQDVELLIRVETDDSQISSLYIDDVSLTDEKHVFLPLAFKDYCTYRYFDDFSNPSSGWMSVDDSEATIRYLAGEYQILLKNPDSWWFVTPDLVLPYNYRIEVDVRQLSTARANYGMIFGARFVGGMEYYQFLVYPPTQEYFLERRDLNDAWTTLIDWTVNAAINVDTPNHLRVDRVGSLIRLYINSVQVNTAADASFTSSGRDAGVVTFSHADAPVDTRFDNFSATCLP